MKTCVIGGIAALLGLGWAGVANAADILETPPVVWSWTGGYAGVNLGLGVGSTDVSDPFGSSIYGDDIRTPGFLVGGQLGYNWQMPNTRWVFGLEGDADWLDAEGTNTCFAFSGSYVSSNCRARPDFVGTLTGRVGYAAGPAGHTLLYVKGGAAVMHNRIDATTNNLYGAFAPSSTSESNTSWGWTAGVGIEQAITPAWSVKAEYDYLGFGHTDIDSPTSLFVSPTGSVVGFVPGRTASVDQSMNLFKIGLNYRFGADAGAQFADAAPAPAMAPSDWSFEGGIRYWYSSGRFRKDLAATSSSSTSLISRLTYDKLTAHSGELYGRVDSPWDVFLKGNVGLGKIVGGHMNDEDWGLFTAAPFTSYSNTDSSLTNTHLNYATVDLGYDFLHGGDYKVGAFVGYNRVHEKYEADDCAQIASPSSGICSPSISGTRVITETDTWNSLRLGVSTDVWLSDRIRLTGDAAYLPYVHFKGVDNHWLRNLVIDESGHGRGAQLEAMMSYYVTPNWSIGVGGRYWTMRTTSGSDKFNGTPTNRDDTFRYQRYGLLLQTAYKF
ncbi:outer membrane beta-barrel protein [Jiella sp. MQZ9-1]|uniref:Outer membrane beta-barrel protein n=1 Tax=Jiella flava TaxID=2816857 RepID=A0A939FVJ0_9HYPH|nr:outer membrane beta-barrel protein [Jiella flava]MBO0662738.1 outer membrane beta-barrel protein [Jiella flava]MCD2471160.1 outer membrane beta-barrel protein [Jiella flava]